MVRVAVAGLGYWGPNLVRNFSTLGNSVLTAICDSDLSRLNEISPRYPQAVTTTNFQDLLKAGFVDAIVIATPTRTHYSLAKLALERGIHVFVEKPLAGSVAECEDLIKIAEDKKVILFVGHVFLYAPAILKLKEIVENRELGNLCYISSARLNLGPVRQDVNALWDLATHDISIILFLVTNPVLSVNCQGMAYLKKNIHDVCSLTMQFANGSIALVNASWLDPNKIRRMTIVGDKKMAVYDDLQLLEKIKIYDKGVDKPDYSDSYGDFHLSYRYGDIYIPKISDSEPLKSECVHFLDSIILKKKPRTDGKNGLQVVKVLSAANRSLQNGGERVSV